MSLDPGQAEINAATRRLAEAGVASPRVDAQLLAAFVLGVPRGRLALVAEFSPAQLSRYRELIESRSRRVPLQHLTGQAAFRHLELAVGPGVFIPRPETESLVQWGLDWLSDQDRLADQGRLSREATRMPIVMDLCAGSGAIATAIAREAANAEVYAVELDPEALVWLRHNVGQLCDIGAPVRVIAGDVLDPDCYVGLLGRVDLVLCNPPYLPAAVSLDPEVAEHDPHQALFGGADGLDLIRPLIGVVARLLRPGGAVGFEHDPSQHRAVPELIAASGRFVDTQSHPDLVGRPRFTTAACA